MFMDSISAIVLFTPVIAPAAVALGIDPLHLGVVFIVNMEIGYLAPPIATNLFVAASIFKRPFGLVTRAVLPSLAILCAGLLVVTYVPTLTVGPVYALRGESFSRPFAREAAPMAPGPASPAATTAPPPSGKVLTIEEMMRAAKAKRATVPPADAGK
jgi:C4-dicarboxylate transporter, DctM subunit